MRVRYWMAVQGQLSRWKFKQMVEVLSHKFRPAFPAELMKPSN